MTLVDEIRENLAASKNGAIRLKMISADYPAWSIRNGQEYGVAVPFKSQEAVAETFTSCSIHARDFNIAGSDHKRYLLLTCTDESLRYEFSTVCAEFVEPGEQGIKRNELVNNPLLWWENWCDLLGNSISDHEPYSVIGEMLALDSLICQNIPVTWEAIHGGSHDIESADAGYEVKSTLQKYESTVTISSHYQMENDKRRLYLYFCRLEKSSHGVSINDMVERLVADGYDQSELEEQLEYLGFEKGMYSRTKKYKCLEKRKYVVDDHFPKITNESFKNNKLPKSIVKIQYTVDLDGIRYSLW